MWLNQDSLARSLTYATSTPEVPSTYIHPFPSPEPPRNILLLIRERITKNISIFPLWNKCSSYLVTTTCNIISRDECSKKERKKRNEKIKRSKCPEPRKKRKSETRGKNGQVSDNRIRGTRYPPERKENEKIEHLILLTKFQRARKVCIPSKSKSRIGLPPLLSPSSPYTIHSPHMHILIWLIGLFLWIHGLTIQ